MDASQGSMRGDHYIPKVGKNRVDHFVSGDKLRKILSQSKEDLSRIFSFDGKAIESTKAGGADAIACAVSDPNFNDCPLVYISAGFDKLTGYMPDFANARNCRFLQPISAIVNDAFNLEERRKMREFCTTLQAPGTTIVNLLLNERYTGERFWNLLHMTYVEVEGELYILGVQTNVDAYMPKNIQKAQHEADQDTRADHYIPKVGKARVDHFVSGDKLRKILSQSKEDLSRIFEFGDSAVTSTITNDDGGIACAVSDPTFNDC